MKNEKNIREIPLEVEVIMKKNKGQNKPYFVFDQYQPGK